MNEVYFLREIPVSRRDWFVVPIAATTRGNLFSH